MKRAGASTLRLFCETILTKMKYEQIRYHQHARKRMRRRKISRAQVERTLQNPDRIYESWGKLAAEGATAQGNTIFVYYVEPEGTSGEALVLSVKRRSSTPRGGRREP
jgi:hypothetical protein